LVKLKIDYAKQDKIWPTNGLCSLLSPCQVIAKTGPTGQLHYDGMANGDHLFHPEDKDQLDFSEPAMLFYAQQSTT